MTMLKLGMPLERFVLIMVPLVTWFMYELDNNMLYINNITSKNGNLHIITFMQRKQDICSNFDCMPCKINVMNICFNLPVSSSEKCSYMPYVNNQSDIHDPSNVRKDKSPLVIKGVKKE